MRRVRHHHFVRNGVRLAIRHRLAGAMRDIERPDEDAQQCDEGDNPTGVEGHVQRRRENDPFHEYYPDRRQHNRRLTPRMSGI